MQHQSIFVGLGALALGALAGRVSIHAPSFEPAAPTVASTPITPEIERVTTLPNRRAPANPAVRVAGIQVQRPLARRSEFGGTSAFFDSDDNLRLALELDLSKVPMASQRQIVEFRAEGSELARFVDDRGTSLATKRAFGGPFELQSRVSEDGLGLLVTLLGNNAPDRAARTIEAEGKLAVLCAGQRAAETSEPIALTQGHALRIGALELKVGKTGPSEFDPARWALELVTDDDLGSVLSWTLVSDDGTATPLDVSMTWRMNQRTSLTLLAPHAVQRAAVRVERWTDAEVLEVPFAVVTGIAPQ